MNMKFLIPFVFIIFTGCEASETVEFTSSRPFIVACIMCKGNGVCKYSAKPRIQFNFAEAPYIIAPDGMFQVGDTIWVCKK